MTNPSNNLSGIIAENKQVAKNKVVAWLIIVVAALILVATFFAEPLLLSTVFKTPLETYPKKVSVVDPSYVKAKKSLNDYFFKHPENFSYFSLQWSSKDKTGIQDPNEYSRPYQYIPNWTGTGEIELWQPIVVSKYHSATPKTSRYGSDNPAYYTYKKTTFGDYAAQVKAKNTSLDKLHKVFPTTLFQSTLFKVVSVILCSILVIIGLVRLGHAYGKKRQWIVTGVLWAIVVPIYMLDAQALATHPSADDVVNMKKVVSPKVVAAYEKSQVPLVAKFAIGHEAVSSQVQNLKFSMDGGKVIPDQWGMFSNSDKSETFEISVGYVGKDGSGNTAVTFDIKNTSKVPMDINGFTFLPQLTSKAGPADLLVPPGMQEAANKKYPQSNVIAPSDTGSAEMMVKNWDEKSGPFTVKIGNVTWTGAWTDTSKKD